MQTLYIAEIQGPYGPLTVPEQVLQQIWDEKKFEPEGMKTVDGEALEVEFPGIWNHQEGPDFLNARLKVGGKEVLGDVEIHFYDKDWEHHGHGKDPEFNRVVLHVVLFPPRGDGIVTQGGNRPPTFVLLPHLEMDLEQYLLDYRLVKLEKTGEMPLVELLAPLGKELLPWHLEGAAKLRWKAKVEAMGHRLSAHSWEEACHQLVMESLGGRRNRAVFAKVALEHPWKSWLDWLMDEDALFKEREGEWKLAGLRPAAHPKARLKQYAALASEHPDWPARLRKWKLPGIVEDWDPAETAAFRKKNGMANLVQGLGEGVFHGAFSKSMLHTLVADGFLPMLANERVTALFPYWYHWHPGNFPEQFGMFLRAQYEERGLVVPLSNGMQQGLLQLLNEAGR